MKNIRKIIFILMCIIFTAGCAGNERQEEGLLLSEPDTASEAEPIFDEEDGSSLEADASENVPEIYVQVSGAVNAPGVYALPEGSRIFQAVELAGGVTDEADLKSLNQAKPLTDGELIWVMTAAEAAKQETPPEEAGDSSAKEDGKVNLNTATKEELMELPGIGAAKAESILAWREANGSFTQIEDLMKIEGIKEGVFSKIENYVKVQ